MYHGLNLKREYHTGKIIDALLEKDHLLPSATIGFVLHSICKIGLARYGKVCVGCRFLGWQPNWSEQIDEHKT